MNAPISHQASGVIPKPAKVEMETVRVKRPFGCRAEPNLVVDSWWRRTVRRLADARQPIQISPAPHNAHLAELAGAYQLRCLEDVFATAPLRAHLCNTVVAPAGLEHGATFTDGFSQRFLDVNILACLAGEHCRQSVPMVRSGDQHCIYVFPLQNTTEVLCDVRLCAAPFLANL